MSSVKVSIIVPVYNVEEYLVKCLDSLINQTLREIEIICINDGSTDNSLEILQAYAQKDNRIIVVDKENEGQGIARNLGISIARGEYIGFVDPDDWASLEMYEKMYNQAKELNSEIVVCNFIKYQDWNGAYWKHNFWSQATDDYKYETLEVPSGVNIDKKLVYKSLIVSPCYSWNKLYKTEFLRVNDIKFSVARCFEDVIFIIDSMHLAKNISYIDKDFYVYRLRMTSTLRSLTLRSLKDIEKQSLNVFKEIYYRLESYNLLKELENNLSFFYTMHSVWTCGKLPSIQQTHFLENLKDEIPAECYKKVKSLLNQKKNKRYVKLANKIFYITNKDRHKVINLAGIRFKFKYLKGQAKLEQKYIDKIIKYQSKYPKDTYLLFDCLHDDTVEAIDAYSLFLYMKNRGKKAYYVLLKTSDLYKKLEENNNLDGIIGLDNSSKTNPGDCLKEIYKPLLRTKAVITSFGENSYITNKFFKSNPFWQYIFIQHGQVFMPSRSIETGYLFPEKFDKFLVSSNNEANIFKKYHFDENKLIKAGLSRWDLLCNLQPQQEKSILLMFTWRSLRLLDFEESLYKKNLLSLINNDDLQAYLSEKNIKLYFAPHHALLTNQGVDFEIENKNIEVVNSCNISKYIRNCNALVTDFSSVSFDFMFQNKPVVFYILDKNDSHLNSLERKGLDSFDYKQYIMPNVLFDEESVVERIKHYVENNFELEPETRQKYDKFFYTKENIRAKLVEEIDKACSETKA